MNICPTCGNQVPPIEIKVCLDSNVLIHRGEVIKFTRQQTEILAILAGGRGLPVAKERILAGLYGRGGHDGPADEAKLLSVQISVLRRHLPKTLRIETFYGVGYALVTTHPKLAEAA